MIELIDIYPTLTQLAQLPTPQHLQGQSLYPVLENPERMGQKKFAYSVVSRGKKLGYALRNQRWRHGKWPDGEELYNLTVDPDEKNNLANKEHVQDRLKEMRDLLSKRQEKARSSR